MNSLPRASLNVKFELSPALQRFTFGTTPTFSKTTQTTNGREFILDSDIEISYTIVMNKNQANTYDVYSKDILLMTLGYSGEIYYKKTKLKKIVHKDHWSYPGFPKRELKIDFNWGMMVDGNITTTVKSGGYFIDWLKSCFSNKKLESYAPWNQINFDSNVVSDLEAICVLFTFLAQFND